MQVYKEKQFIVFELEENKIVKYNLQTKESIGLNNKPVKNLKTQLRGYTMQNLIDDCSDEKYANFLKFVQNSESEYPIYNIGTILERLPKYSNFEQFFSAGINHLSKDFSYKITDLPKSLIKLLQNNNFYVTNDFVKNYIENIDIYNMAFNMEYISLDKDDIKRLLDAYHWGRYNGKYQYNYYFLNLINSYNYNAKALLKYIDYLATFEALDDMYDIIKELTDYARMMSVISNKYEKYPKHFLTTHTIACRTYNRLKLQFSEDIFKNRIRKDLEWEYGKYKFIYPKCTQDIKDEAVQQSNCVASYIQKVIDGDCHIMFMRYKDSPDESLVTLEIRNNQIVQAKRKYNDDVSIEEQKAINAFNEKKGK